jgi:hypothetical protein
MIAVEKARPIGYLVAVSGPGGRNLRGRKRSTGVRDVGTAPPAAAAEGHASSAVTVWG